MKRFTGRSQSLHRRIYGIDFSGAKDAGKKIWISEGVIEGDALLIEKCCRAEQLPGSGSEREYCFSALREFIADSKDSAFGLDFPFGLPLMLVDEKSWEDFALKFIERYRDFRMFREKCRSAATNREIKRITDMESKAPFSPYNIRVYRQTYYGIRDILSPLVEKQQACVLPMQSALPGKPWILEICPASTLKKMHLYEYPYKGKAGNHHLARNRILGAIESTGEISIPAGSVKEKILNDRGGDALDSVIAAYATFQAIRNPLTLEGSACRAYMLEGYVFL